MEPHNPDRSALMMVDDDGPRLCECGCGEILVGSRRRRFVDDAHRKRFARAVGSNGHRPPVNADTDTDMPDTVADMPDIVPGSVLAGLEDWLAGLEDVLPGAAVSQARMLAGQLDANPSASPLHGRYSTVVALLVEAADQVAGQLRADFHATTGRLIATGCEEQMHGRHVLVVCGECSRERIRRCVAGSHEWEVHGADPLCTHCGTRRSGRRERS